MNSLFERSIGLLGKEKYDQISTKVICIFGVGGVGCTALESLARTGFRKFILVDFDFVSLTNLNRQILYGLEDVYLPKVICAKKYLLNIDPEIEVETFNMKAQDFDFNRQIDFVIDAIDDVDGKTKIVLECEKNKIPYIVSLGMANRYDPSKVSITTLDKTFNDPLAKKIRYTFKENGISLSQVNVVFSLENPGEFEGKLNSIMMVPSSAGLNIAYYVLKHFMEE